MRPVAYRLRQGLRALLALRSNGPVPLPDAVLTPAQAAAVRRLPAPDQAHLGRVHRELRRRGAASPDLLLAGLLHDLGKVAPDGRARLGDRVGYVLLGAGPPRFRDRLTRWPAPAWRRGLALAAHHPRLGAERARALGCSERTCWLIAHHADDPPPDDPDLRALIAADRNAG